MYFLLLLWVSLSNVNKMSRIPWVFKYFLEFTVMCINQSKSQQSTLLLHRILKGLVAVCHSFCLFFVFITNSTDIHSITFIFIG
jgi:hypothetical protein